MSREAPSADPLALDAAAPIVEREQPDRRRRWISPALLSNSTLTTVTQVGSPVPLSLLFLQASNQCFDSHGRPAPCT